MANWIVEKLLKSKTPKTASYLRSVVSGSFYRISDIKGNSSLADIRSLVELLQHYHIMLQMPRYLILQVISYGLPL